MPPSGPPPKRNSSLEMTAVRPGPRVSLRDLASLDLDPEHPETRALMARAQEGREDAETLEPCPGPCRSCPCCHGDRMVTPTKAAMWKAQQKAISELDEPANDGGGAKS